MVLDVSNFVLFTLLLLSGGEFYPYDNSYYSFPGLDLLLDL
jgi:hypothetical protein